MARVLFVEPFYGGSHRAFLDGLGAHSRHEFVPLTLPDGEWRRRMRRGAQELAPAAARLGGTFDLIIASDMLDVPAFLALTRPRFFHVPVMLYMHENQFTYPRLRGTKFNSWFGQINYLSALSADVVAFNSAYHRDDFLGAIRVLEGQPNNWILPGAVEAIEARSSVLPIGVELAWLDEYRREQLARNPVVLWNHRWEFDKAPELFARSVRRLLDEGEDFRIAVAGAAGENPSAELMALNELPAERLRHFGYLESREAYGRLLCESDIVVSTTRHEFFGVGMVEAMYAGCVPLAPRRFNYPALVPAECHADCLYETPDDFVRMLRALLHRRPGPEPLRHSAARFSWPEVAPTWDTAIAELASHENIAVRSQPTVRTRTQGGDS